MLNVLWSYNSANYSVRDSDACVVNNSADCFVGDNGAQHF